MNLSISGPITVNQSEICVFRTSVSKEMPARTCRLWMLYESIKEKWSGQKARYEENQRHLKFWWSDAIAGRVQAFLFGQMLS